MMNVLRGVSAVAALALVLSFSSVTASAQTENTALSKQLERIDLGVMGIGLFSNTTTGTNNQQTTNPGEPLTTQPTRSFNAFAQVAYTHSKWFGVQFNYVHGRYTYNFNYLAPVPQGAPVAIYEGVQTNADEYSFGYLVHPHPTKFVKPFASVGIGGIDFAPTQGGGNQLKPQGRLDYFYSIGGDVPLNNNFGFRLQIRQNFTSHPDYGSTYLRDLKRSETVEPAVGFYLRF